MKRKILALALLIVCTLGVLFTPGCGSTPEERQQQIKVVRETKGTIGAEIAVLSAELVRHREAANALPENDPVRETILKAIDTVERALAKATGASADADKLISDIESGQVTPEGTLSVLRKIPVVGPYADLAVVLGASIYGLWQRNKRNAQVKELLARWRSEEPVGTSPAMEAAERSIGAS